MRVWGVTVLALLLLLSACGSSHGGGTSGGSSSSRLSAGSYRAHLKTVAKESDAAQHAVENGFHATSMARLITVLTSFGTAEKRIGEQVVALNPPSNAQAANTELAKGERDTASEVRALLPKIKKTPSAQAAIAYLTKHSTSKSGREIDHALAQLKRLGYIKNVS